MIGLTVMVTVGSTVLWSAQASDSGSLVDAADPPAIVGGEVDETNEFPSVVAIQAHERRCTGIMVSPTVVLTAAHCIEDLEYGRTALIYPGAFVSSDEDRIQGIRWGMHPDYCPDCTRNRFDYGFIELFAEYEPEGGFVLPIDSHARWDSLVRPSTKITAVGYGAQREGVNDPWARRMVELEVSRVIRGGLEFEAEGRNGGTCEGDSGSPAFMRFGDGSVRWVGIDSRGLDCGVKTVYGASYAALCWLRDEADVDLLPTGCETCDCVDATTQGCGCRTSTNPSAAPLHLLWLLYPWLMRKVRQPLERSQTSPGTS